MDSEEPCGGTGSDIDAQLRRCRGRRGRRHGRAGPGRRGGPAARAGGAVDAPHRPAYPEIEPGTTSGAVRTLQCVLDDTALRAGRRVDGTRRPGAQAAIDDLTGSFECCIEKPLRGPHVVPDDPLLPRSRQAARTRSSATPASGSRRSSVALRADGETLGRRTATSARRRTAQVKAVPGQVRHHAESGPGATTRRSFYLSRARRDGRRRKVASERRNDSFLIDS